MAVVSRPSVVVSVVVLAATAVVEVLANSLYSAVLSPQAENAKTTAAAASKPAAARKDNFLIFIYYFQRVQFQLPG